MEEIEILEEKCNELNYATKQLKKVLSISLLTDIDLEHIENYNFDSIQELSKSKILKGKFPEYKEIEEYRAIDFVEIFHKMALFVESIESIGIEHSGVIYEIFRKWEHPYYTKLKNS